MDAVAVDPIAALQATGEGRFEWVKGSLVEMAPPSSEHGREMLFLASIMDYYAVEREAGQVMPDGFAQRLEPELVRVPDVSFFKKANLDKIKATHSEGGADLVVEIVSPESRNRDRGEKFYDYERAGVEEYWIVDPGRRSAEFYRLDDGVYQPVLPDDEGKVYSSALPGFFVRVRWLWERPTPKEALRELGVL